MLWVASNHIKFLISVIMKKSILYLIATALLLVACEPSASYLHLIFNITDNVTAVISINTSRHCRASVGEEEIGVLSLNLSSAETQRLKSVTVSSVSQTIVGRIEPETNLAIDCVDDARATITMSNIDAEISATPTSFYVAMLPNAFADGDITIDLEFVDYKQTLSLPALTLERGMVLDVDCTL